MRPSAQEATGAKATAPSTWNTTNLGWRIGADAAAAGAASVLVAPVIAIIDRSIVTRTHTKEPLRKLLRQNFGAAFARPHRFLLSRAYFLVAGLYFSTYLTANAVDTATSTVKSRPATSITSNTTKFLATSAVNMTACVYKDAQFARLFAKPAPSLPKISLALFAARDCMTIFASFNLPPLLAPKLAHLPAPIQKRLKRILSTESGRLNTAQFLTPAAMQIFSTPIHLLGFDLNNRQAKLGVAERFNLVKSQWAGGALARMGRIIPAFGIGGVVNAKVRRGLMEQLE